MQKFDQEIAAALEKQTNKQNNNKLRHLKGTGRAIYVIGKNAESYEFANRHLVAGLIDDFDRKSQTWQGIPIVKLREISRNSIIINCSTSISPVTVSKNLKEANFNNVIELSDLISEDGEILPLPWFVAQQRDEITEHLDWWRELNLIMADETSKKTLLDVLRFRITADLCYMTDYSVRLNDQYFEDFMKYNGEVFVDAGGYDGDTTAEFIKRYPDYKKVYLFEPSRKNLSAAKDRLSGRRDIDFRFAGLSNSKGSLRFNADAGSASAVTDGIGETINVVTLDEELGHESISFIKMDLEGWEMNSLLGAEKIIKVNKPKLAIAVYHHAKDFREIPAYLLGLNPEYKVYLRHYTQGWSETVMYFI